jgi:serine/threonine protein kinase
VPARSLAAVLWRFGSALVRVFAVLHARGIVHCDVKPANLLVRGDEVRVIDFGISRHLGEPWWDDHTVKCSSGWAAPEQLHAVPPTPAVDVLARGCVLAHLAGGVHPFGSPSGHEWFQRVQSAEPDLSDLPRSWTRSSGGAWRATRPTASAVRWAPPAVGGLSARNAFGKNSYDFRFLGTFSLRRYPPCHPCRSPSS